jgi:outer membrane protein assembly factor BamA
MIRNMRVSMPAIGVLMAISCLCLPSFAQQPAKVNQVAVTGNVNINTDAILNVVAVKVGSDYSKDAVEKDKQAIMSLGFFSAVT